MLYPHLQGRRRLPFCLPAVKRIIENILATCQRGGLQDDDAHRSRTRRTPRRPRSLMSIWMLAR